jgi:hypothetical protein
VLWPLTIVRRTSQLYTGARIAGRVWPFSQTPLGAVDAHQGRFAARLQISAEKARKYWTRILAERCATPNAVALDVKPTTRVVFEEVTEERRSTVRRKVTSLAALREPLRSQARVELATTSLADTGYARHARRGALSFFLPHRQSAVESDSSLPTYTHDRHLCQRVRDVVASTAGLRRRIARVLEGFRPRAQSIIDGSESTWRSRMYVSGRHGRDQLRQSVCGWRHVPVSCSLSAGNDGAVPRGHCGNDGRYGQNVGARRIICLVRVPPIRQNCLLHGFHSAYDVLVFDALELLLADILEITPEAAAELMPRLTVLHTKPP